jgi:siroheme synthase (precorrin-2 oxidase/ferrochelatase)
MDEQELFSKNVTLSTEFNKYLIEHPEFAEQIPDEAVVILLPADDPKLCAENLRLAEQNRKVDDVPDRPVVHVKIERLIPPPPSRLVNPTVELVR